MAGHGEAGGLAAHGGAGGFAAHGGIVVGVSGGADSLALVAALVAELWPESAHGAGGGGRGVPIEAVIVDHQLQAGSRGVAEAAAATVRSWDDGSGQVSARVVPVEVPGTGESLEARARVARYRALASVASGRPVFIAHTQDDQAETYLLGALRGNPSGLSVVSAIEGATVIRPLLAVRRADTQAACTELGLTPWQDPHNSDSRFRRVRIRQDVLPLLGAVIGGDAVPAIAQAGARVAKQQQERELASSLPLRTADLPETVRHELIAALLRTTGARVSVHHIGEIDRLLTDWHGQGPLDVGGGLVALRVADAVIVQSKNQAIE